MKDVCYGDTSLKDAASLNDWNATIRAFLAHGSTTPTHLGAVLAANPDFAMAQAVRGLFCMLLGRREMVTTATEALALAKTGRANHPRELSFITALELWLNGHPTRSIAALETILLANPADTLAMKLSQAIRFVMGDAKGMRASVERVLTAHGKDHPLRGFALGCHAFTLEETGDYAGAEASGLLGLEAAPDDAWGLHAVAHVYDMTAQSQRGIDLINSHDGSWLHCNNFRYHVWWHKALLHLDRGEIDAVLDIYDTKMRVDKTDDYRDIANASSLLMRLSLEGICVGTRWEELADISERRIDDGCLAFADLHYMLALIGGERDFAIKKLLSRLGQTANKTQPQAEFDQIRSHPGLVCANGLAAFAEGNFEASFIALSAARPVMQAIGGSHAQRDVFERLTIDAGIRAGQADKAEALLLQRISARAGTEDHFTALRRDAIAALRQSPFVHAAQ
jgi:hypothetical protein